MSSKNGPLALVMILIVIAVGASFMLGDVVQGNQESVTLGFEIHYSDGSTKKLDPSSTGFGALAITDRSGKQVDRLRYFVNVRTVYDGTVTTADFTGSTVLIIVDETTRDTQGPGAFMGVPASGEYTTILDKTLDDGALEAWSIYEGEHTLTVYVTLFLRMDLSDGRSQMRAVQLESKASFNYEYDDGITNLSIISVKKPLSQTN